jgi:hypothetical protein
MKKLLILIWSKIKSIGAWIWNGRGAAWAFIKKYWKVFAGIGVAIGAFLLVKKVVAVIEGKVKPTSRVWWNPVPSPYQISVQVQKGEKPIVIDLPQGVTSDKVSAVGVDLKDNAIIVVEVLHEKVDRSGSDPIPDNALSSLGRDKP